MIANKNGNFIDSKTEICNELNNFFVNVVNNLEINYKPRFIPIQRFK